MSYFRSSAFVVPALLSFLLVACKAETKEQTQSSSTTADKVQASASKGNHLSFKMNGVEWVADNDIFGAVHPAGYDQAILIAGSKGPKDKNEQAFNINLYKAAGPGTYEIATSNPEMSVVQLANLSPENYLYGSILGFKMKVTVIKASKSPEEIEVTFEGELQGNASDKLQITEGKFYFHE